LLCSSIDKFNSTQTIWNTPLDQAIGDKQSVQVFLDNLDMSYELRLYEIHTFVQPLSVSMRQWYHIVEDFGVTGHWRYFEQCI
jgi:hypothetical protein